MNDILDKYYYARKHSDGPGAWCVLGPNGFEMSVPGLDKSVAYVISRVLSGEFGDAIEMLQSLKRCCEFDSGLKVPSENTHSHDY
jgi:hypothetical protein